MKQLFLGLVLSLCGVSLSLQAQALRVDPTPAMTTSGAAGPGGFPQLLAVPGAKIAVCNSPANGTPCTNYATTYTDVTMTTSCPMSAQIVLAGTSTCVGSADVLGNFGFWIAPGTYAYTVTLSTGQSYGPYPLTVTVATGAANVNYTLGYSGAVTRTVASKLGDVISVKDFGAKGDGTTNDTTAFVNALNAASAGQQVFVPAGSYNCSSITSAQSNVSLVLDPGASVNCSVTFAGAGYYRSNTVAVSGTYAAGTTTFSGNFSAYSVGQTVLIEQAVAQSNNQIGLEVATVTSASSTQLFISETSSGFTGTRYPYTNPQISLLSNAIQSTAGTTARGSLSITGNYTSAFSVGDLVRIENTGAVDAPDASKNYFEIAKVASITTGAITFENALHAQYTSPWLIKLNRVQNISVQGGYIQSLYLTYAEKLSVNDLTTQLLSAGFDYNFKFNNLRGATNQTVAYVVYFAWNGAISNVMAYGGQSSTDNGNVKIAQVGNVAISNVSTYYDVASAQGAYPFMVDYNFTPYSIWNQDVTINGVTTGATNSPDFGIFLAGLRESTATGLSTPNGITLRGCGGLIGAAWYTNGMLQVRSGTGYQLSNFYADSVSLGDDSSVTFSKFDAFKVNGGSTAFFSRSVWIRGHDLSFTNGTFSASGNVSFYVNDSTDTNLYFDLIQDAPSGGAYSIYNGGASADVLLGFNRFAGPIGGGGYTQQTSPNLYGLSFSGGSLAPATSVSGFLGDNFSNNYGEVNFWNDYQNPQTAGNPGFTWRVFDNSGVSHEVANIDRTGQFNPQNGINIASGGSTMIGAGVGSVKMSSANAATNTAWIPIKYNGTTYYVPAWTTNAP